MDTISEVVCVGVCLCVHAYMCVMEEKWAKGDELALVRDVTKYQSVGKERPQMRCVL